uniref:G-protein coupled receptors family 1 profile domain-containing protein n=1 Tax=Equus asinus asinus TaxID=83772 RepID=A0A8C4LPH1_EQUAS
MGSNQTCITEVILLGFQLDPELEIFLSGFFLSFYSLALMGNAMILGLICLDSRLHTPMYFFLSNLAIVDMSYASSIFPKMLANLVMQKKTVSFTPHILQTFLYLACAVTVCEFGGDVL